MRTDPNLIKEKSKWDTSPILLCLIAAFTDFSPINTAALDHPILACKNAVT